MICDFCGKPVHRSKTQFWRCKATGTLTHYYPAMHKKCLRLARDIEESGEALLMRVKSAERGEE